MPLSPQDIATKVEATKGKKARRKKLKSDPAGTSSKKLPSDIRKGLEQHFGARLAKVRVHTGGNAKEVCRELKAKAFTSGNDVYFMKPGDAKNADLLVHELAHVLQQGGGKMPKPKEGIVFTSK